MAVPAASGRRGLTRPESHRDASRVLTAAPADNIFCQHLPPRNLVIGSSVQCELNNTTTLTGPNRTRSIIQLQRLVSQYRCVFTHAISKKPQAHTQHTNIPTSSHQAVSSQKGPRARRQRLLGPSRHPLSAAPVSTQHVLQSIFRRGRCASVLQTWRQRAQNHTQEQRWSSQQRQGSVGAGNGGAERPNTMVLNGHRW